MSSGRGPPWRPGTRRRSGRALRPRSRVEDRRPSCRARGAGSVARRVSPRVASCGFDDVTSVAPRGRGAGGGRGAVGRARAQSWGAPSPAGGPPTGLAFEPGADGGHPSAATLRIRRFAHVSRRDDARNGSIAFLRGAALRLREDGPRDPPLFCQMLTTRALVSGSVTDAPEMDKWHGNPGRILGCECGRPGSSAWIVTGARLMGRLSRTRRVLLTRNITRYIVLLQSSTNHP